MERAAIPARDKGFGDALAEAVERDSCEGEEGNSHGTYVRLVRMALWQRPTRNGRSSPRKDVNSIWRPWLFKPAPALCVSVCSMLMWACVDVNRTRLGDTGRVENKEGIGSHVEETGATAGEGSRGRAAQGQRSDLDSLFYFGPEVDIWPQWVCL